MTRILLLLGLLLAWDAAAQSAKPNIVIMMADDMGIGDTSAYLGRRLMPASEPIARTLRTPQLEKFAQRAIVFTDAHAGASMCSSSRYSLLTGRFGHRPYLKRQGWLPHGPNLPMIQPELLTLPEMLQEQGYRTACIGKYHVGMAFDNGAGQPASDFYHHDVDFTKPLLNGPTHNGFDEFFGVPGNTEDPLDTEPRIYIRNDRWTFSKRNEMVMMGTNKHEGKILADPSWKLSELGPVYLREVEAFLERAHKSDDPFFLYYVPNANHNQRHEGGMFSVPDSILGQPVAGASRYNDGTAGNPRADMVLENDIAFGRVLELLETLPDPRNPGHMLIDNTLVIFTSDNGPNEGEKLGPSLQSGGLHGRKASMTEGGMRVPFLLYWKGTFEGGKINRTHFALTDIYATLAQILKYPLQNADAQDSYDVLDYWLGSAKDRDMRPRLKFCHLGPPYANDAMCIREGEHKIIVGGGVAEPGHSEGNRGAVLVERYNNLYTDPLESIDQRIPENEPIVQGLARDLLILRNRGHARPLSPPAEKKLVVDDGWHNLRNDLDGGIGFTFMLSQEGPIRVTHLGMWDDHEKDRPVRGAAEAPNDNITERQSHPEPGGRGLAAAHEVLLSFNGKVLARATLRAGNAAVLEGEYRYAALEAPVTLSPGITYQLTMTTTANDGDQWHNPASYDGLSPQTHPVFTILRSIYRTGDGEAAIPTYFDAAPDYWKHRLPVGPTLKFE